MGAVVSRHFHSQALLLQLPRSFSILSTSLRLCTPRLTISRRSCNTDGLILFFAPVAFLVCVFCVYRAVAQQLMADTGGRYFGLWQAQRAWAEEEWTAEDRDGSSGGVDNESGGGDRATPP